MPTKSPYIPEYITVHLGAPTSKAQNVTLLFSDYIKNVASSEIYPTWNESAIIANIYAQTSFALNRIFLEYYPSRGYNFNITNTTAFDQSFNPGRNIFDNIGRLVDELFNDYIRKGGFIEPLSAKYCNGTTSTCAGLSQWGSEELAVSGYSSIDILRYYYGDTIEIVADAPVLGLRASYPGTPLKQGSTGPNVVVIQESLNRISQNYPLIPKVYPIDGIFGKGTENAVKKFQGIFNLTQDGIVGKATWYKLVFLYSGIKKLGELDSEGLKIFGRSLEYPDAISMGDRGEKVLILQYFLSVLAEFYRTQPFVEITGTFEAQTQNAVLAFQQGNDLALTGVVGADTWDKIYNAFRGVEEAVFVPNTMNSIQARPYPGNILKLGSRGDSVTILQQYLNAISVNNTNISPVPVTGIFGPQTVLSVTQYQTQSGLPRTGVVERLTWNSIINSYKDAVSSTSTSPRQFPGYSLKLGARDPAPVWR